MKINIFLLIFFLSVLGLHAQVSKTVNVDLNGLSTALTAAEKNSVKYLTITGTVFDQDFITMRDEMGSLVTVDLANATLSDNSVPKDAFNGKESLESLILPSSVVAIEDNAFWGCTGLTDITSILSSVHSIGEYAFWQCSGITDLVLPNTVQSIGRLAFGLCTGLTSITIPESVSLIGLGAFAEHKCPLSIDPGNQYYTIINEVLFNKSVTTLIECPVTMSGTYQIPSTVTTIAEYAFFDCFFVTSVVFPPALETIGIQAFNLCGLKGQLILPSSLKSIGRSAFSDVVGITGELKMPSGVTSIGDQAFMNCQGLTSVVIPSSVKEIGGQVFSGCSGITSITLNSSNPENFTGFLIADNAKCVLHVPYGSKSAYSESQQWKVYKTIIENPTGLYVSSSDIYLERTEGSSAILNVKANVGWKFNCDQPWLKIEPTSGSNDAQVTLKAIEPNQSTANRIAEVQISSTGFETQVISVIQKGSTEKIAVSAGKLYSLLSVAKRSTLKGLTLSGTMDATDFVTLRDSIPLLQYLDLADVSILAYSGLNGSSWVNDYPADEIPFSAFYSELTNKGSQLKTIIFPKSAKSIGEGAFMKCQNLKTVQFPPSLMAISNAAFYEAVQKGSLFFMLQFLDLDRMID
jgi:hypothetical protein